MSPTWALNVTFSKNVVAAHVTRSTSLPWTGKPNATFRNVLVATQTQGVSPPTQFLSWQTTSRLSAAAHSMYLQVHSSEDVHPQPEDAARRGEKRDTDIADIHPLVCTSLPAKVILILASSSFLEKSTNY